MVDAARQMLDELMGRNRNLHPSEAPRQVNWDDPDFCPYHIVRFCPHDLFINTRADLGPCPRIHDDEAKALYELARSTARKRQFEDEFLRFCNTMLNDVDRKIQKGKQRLQLMQRDQPVPAPQLQLSKYQEQINTLNGRIKKLLSEAEEAGIRGDVDQAQDLMALCEQLKDEKDALVAQHESNNVNKECGPAEETSEEDNAEKSPKAEGDDKKGPNWMQDLGNTITEKQMEVCEICGAFLIVGDAQQRIEDHLMGKQHLGYSKLRKALAEIHERRKNERNEEENKRREDLGSSRSNFKFDDRQRDCHDRRDRRGSTRGDRLHHDGGRDYSGYNSRHSEDRHRHHSKSHRRRRSHSRTRSPHSNSRSRSHHRRSSRDYSSRSRSRSRY